MTDIKKEISKKILETNNKEIDIRIKEIKSFYDKKNIKEEQREELNNYFIDRILSISEPLNRKDFSKFVQAFKKEKIYNYKKNKKNRFLLKRFTKIYLYLYFYKYTKEKGYIFFYNKIPLFRNNKIKYYDNLLKQKNGLKKVIKRYLYLNYTEIVITTKCSLRCKNCANLISSYKKTYDVDDKIIKESLKNYFNIIDGVDCFRILGGEPFCNPKLKEYLKYIDYTKTKTVEIVTNGTIVPKDEKLYQEIRKYNVKVHISNYGKYSTNIDKLIKKLENEKIEYNTNDADIYWYDYGKLVNYNREKEDLKSQFKNCDNICKSILNGYLYYCPRYSHGYDLGIVERKKNEYVNLLSDNIKQSRKTLRKLFFNNRPLEVCKYCLYGTAKCKKVKPAIQSAKKYE